LRDKKADELLKDAEEEDTGPKEPGYFDSNIVCMMPLTLENSGFGDRYSVVFAKNDVKVYLDFFM
jgi:hypothetical protein